MRIAIARMMKLLRDSIEQLSAKMSSIYSTFEQDTRVFAKNRDINTVAE